MSTDLSRRTFLGATATAAVSACTGSRLIAAAPAPGGPAGDALPFTRIRKIYLAKPVPTWPKPDLDVEKEIRRIEIVLDGLAEKMGGIRLEGGDLFRLPSEVPTSAGALGNPDGLLVFNLTSGVSQQLQLLASTGLPTILYSQPFSGHDWSIVPAMQRSGHRIICLATSDSNEIPGSCRLIRAAHLLRNTRILYLNEKPVNPELAARIKERVGAEILHIGPARVNAAYDAVDGTAAEQDARDWISGALKVVEPREQELVKASRLYLGLSRIMQEEGARAVTINCLGLFRDNRLPAYPCLAFCRLNDLGLVGVCEADIDSTLTQLILTDAFGVPGFVSDPVVDTSSNTVIHAHCVSATRMDGPAGPRAPYIVRSHMEDNKGASLQVKMRVGQIITAAKLVNLETMLVSTGTIVDNPDLDRGCRTKITTRVADARKVLANYAGGLHRVICYGDRLGPIRDLAGLMRFDVVEEC